MLHRKKVRSLKNVVVAYDTAYNLASMIIMTVIKAVYVGTMDEGGIKKGLLNPGLEM